MRKVMISVPDELVLEFDQLADNLGKTRSGLIQELMAERIRRSKKPSKERMLELLDRATTNRGGRTTEMIREDRGRGIER